MKRIHQAIERAAIKISLAAVAVLMAVEAADAQQTEKKAAVAGDSSTRQVLVSIPDRKLALIEDGEVKAVYPVAVGKDSTPSPAGDFIITTRLTDPTYYHPGKVIGPGAENPLGTRWIGLSKKGFGIHGTNAPKSIGKAASHGCIRMRRADLEQLFTKVRTGDQVTIRGERDEQIAAVFGGTTTTIIADAAAATQSSNGSDNH